MEIAVSLGLILIPYLLGSINAAVIVSKGLYGVDIRTLGSFNAGSTNMFRMLGFKAGVITQIVDIGKGSLAAALPLILATMAPKEVFWFTAYDLELQAMACGMLAVIGHLYPIYFGFKGGKGVNTLLGMMLVTNWQASLICLAVWILVNFVIRYVAIASMSGVLAYPIYLIFHARWSGEPIDWLLVGFGFAMFLLVVFTHRSNIANLMKGKENKTKMFSRKSKAKTK
jgi:acyl phosphate:glycerol-3-phosphate acyltransferase